MNPNLEVLKSMQRQHLATEVIQMSFMGFTGFALYAEGQGMDSWWYDIFAGWLIPLFGQSQDVHTWHHLGMHTETFICP
jgi:Ni,Fe-hydrogenase I cytochrome b subunit